MEIIKGTEEYYNESVKALEESDLGKYYFNEFDLAKSAIREAVNTNTFYVCIEDGKFLGFMYYLKNGAFHSFPYLHLIAVKESERGKGVGSFMLEYLEKLINSKKLFLVVGDFNIRAKELYMRKGFVQVGKIEGLYRKGITEFVMMKELK